VRWLPLCCKCSTQADALQLEAVGTTGHLGLVVLITIPKPRVAIVRAIEVAGWIARTRHSCCGVIQITLSRIANPELFARSQALLGTSLIMLNSKLAY
jgi:hypothetical protein